MSDAETLENYWASQEVGVARLALFITAFSAYLLVRTAIRRSGEVMQKNLAESKDDNKPLKHFDPPPMKSNLDGSKKKLAEKTETEETLQNSLGQAKNESPGRQ